MAASDSLQLQFGVDATWELPGRDTIQPFMDSNVPAVTDITSAVYDALESPIEFPSLDQAVVPGDSLVFAVDSAIPRLPEVLIAVLGWFQAKGCSLENIHILLAGNGTASDAGEAGDALADILKQKLGTSISVESHDPDDEQKVAYVAANQDSNPIYMNRTLVDADVAIPITCSRSTNSLDFFGSYGLYPLLSDRTTRGAFYRFTDLDRAKTHGKLTDWANQAAKWAGFLVAIQVIPASQNQVAAVRSGLMDALEAECEKSMNEAWKTAVNESHLTIALLDCPAQQNWLGLARSLYKANQCTRDGGAIALCTQLHESLGKSLGRLRRESKSEEALSKKLAKDTSDDAIAASMIHSITQDKHLYLASKMRPDTVESIGIGAVRENRELAHLTEQFPSVAVLSSAQHRHIELIG
ncbi:MAG: lactate racemase domain-containing protein [Planctomycetota bacterium]